MLISESQLNKNTQLGLLRVVLILFDYFGPKEGRCLWSRLSVHYTRKHGS